MIIEHKALGIVQSVLGFQGDVMGQLSFSYVEYGVERNKSKREIFLEEMDSVMPLHLVIKLFESGYLMFAVGRPAYPLASTDHCALESPDS